MLGTGAVLGGGLISCGESGGGPIEVELPSVPAPGPEDANDPPEADDDPGALPNGTVSCGQGVSPGKASARLLTRAQYDNTVRDLLGDESQPARSFPAENTLLGFGNNADAHRSSLLLSEGHLSAATEVAERAVLAGVDELLPCEAGDRSASCMEAFVSGFGYRAFRRPLTAEEVTPFVELFQNGTELWGFDKALELVIQSFLQSPQLLYRTETLAADETSGLVTLDSYQVASRLSYFLWNTMPDAELFDLADAGELVDVEVVRAQAERMLEDERARDTVSDFYGQWLGTARFAGLARQVEGSDSVGTFNDAWRNSLDRFVQHAFWDAGGNLEALMTSSSVFLEGGLAELYGLAPTAEGEPADDPSRAGVLTQPALMALLAHPDQSAPVQRGKFVREQILCHQLPPPPPDVDTSPPDPDPGATTRERFRQHSSDQRCGQCHRLLDTVGFGFEGFDHLGRVRTEEYGIVIDVSGDVVDAGDANLEGPFNGALELSAKLAASPVVEQCLATQWFRYAMGRAEQNADVCSLDAIKEEFSSSGGDFRSLLVAIATVDAFRFRTADEQDY